MSTYLLRTSILVIACGYALPVHAETTGWSWGPFASSTSKMEVSAQTKEPHSWMPKWKMPDVTGSLKKASQSVATKTSNAWNSATRTTKRAWKKTTEVLDPFPNDPQPNASASNSKSGGFSGWFGGSSKDEKPATVQEFLRGERP